MRRTLCVLLALTLLLFTLSGCSGIDMSWFTDKFKSGDAQADAAPAETTPPAGDDRRHDRGLHRA